MWDGWDPVKDYKDEWEASKSIWGQIKVIFFYVGIWLAILGLLYLFFVPSTLGFDCLAADEAGVAVRLWLLYVLSFLLFTVRDGTKLSNLRFLTGVIILTYAIMYWFGDSMGDCFDATFRFVWYDIGWVLIMTICAYVERRVDGDTGGTTGETTPLVE